MFFFSVRGICDCVRILTRCPIRNVRQGRLEAAQDHLLMYTFAIERLNELQRDSGLQWDDPHLVQHRNLIGDRLKMAFSALRYQQGNQQPLDQPLNEKAEESERSVQWYSVVKHFVVAHLICFLYWLIQKLIMHL